MTGRAWVAFATVALLWGIPYFLIKVAVADVSPAIVALSRLVLGAVILLPIAWRRGALGPAWRRLPWVALIGVEYMAVAWLLIPLGETYISSSLAAVMVACVPLMVILLSLRRERPQPVQLAGLVAGLAGVAIMVGVDVAGRPAELIGAACLVGVVICYAVSPIIISRRLSGTDQIGVISLALAIGAVVEAVPAALTLPRHAPSLTTIGALAGLGVLCTAIAMVVFFLLITEAGPSRATVVTYINPLIAVLLGVIVLGERFTASIAIGGALILAGSWFATRGARPRASQPAPARASTSP